MKKLALTVVLAVAAVCSASIARAQSKGVTFLWRVNGADVRGTADRLDPTTASDIYRGNVTLSLVSTKFQIRADTLTIDHATPDSVQLEGNLRLSVLK